jgi:hypothetical protein
VNLVDNVIQVDIENCNKPQEMQEYNNVKEVNEVNDPNVIQ